MSTDFKHIVVRFMVVAIITIALLLIASTPLNLNGTKTSSITAKANGCRTNIDLINSQIELYYANTSSWPATLDVVTGDTTYFPDGFPVCPVTGEEYSNILVNNRVDTTGHAH